MIKLESRTQRSLTPGAGTKKEQQGKLVGKIILADFLEYPLQKFINFVQAVKELSLYRKLTREGIVICQPLLGAKILKKGISASLGDGVIAKIGKERSFKFSICYTKKESSVGYIINNEKLREIMSPVRYSPSNGARLTKEEKRNISGLLHKLRRITTRNRITHEILKGIMEHQRDYLESNRESGMGLKLKPLQMTKLTRTISNSDGKESGYSHSFIIDASRISRVTRRISIVTPQGKEVSLKNLFPAKRDIVKEHLKVIFNDEREEIYNGRVKKPYTDESLRCKLDNEYNLSVTRREVAYCRNDMGVSPYSKRLNSYGYPPLSANFSKIYPFTIPLVRDNAPACPGVYELRLTNDMIEYPGGCCQIFYMGSAKNLRKRLLDHLGSNGKNGGIKRFLAKEKCVFRYIRVPRGWTLEEKSLYDLFATTFGDSPVCNYVSPRMSEG